MIIAWAPELASVLNLAWKPQPPRLISTAQQYCGHARRALRALCDAQLGCAARKVEMKGLGLGVSVEGESIVQNDDATREKRNVKMFVRTDIALDLRLHFCRWLSASSVQFAIAHLGLIFGAGKKRHECACKTSRLPSSPIFGNAPPGTQTEISVRHPFVAQV